MAIRSGDGNRSRACRASAGSAYWAGDGTMKPRIIAARAGRILGLDLKTGVPVTDWPDGGFNFGFPQG